VTVGKAKEMLIRILNSTKGQIEAYARNLPQGRWSPPMQMFVEGWASVRLSVAQNLKERGFRGPAGRTNAQNEIYHLCADCEAWIIATWWKILRGTPPSELSGYIVHDAIGLPRTVPEALVRHAFALAAEQARVPNLTIRAQANATAAQLDAQVTEAGIGQLDPVRLSKWMVTTPMMRGRKGASENSLMKWLKLGGR
jgi:hypothetical protein